MQYAGFFYNFQESNKQANSK